MDDREGTQSSNMSVRAVRERLERAILERKKAGLAPYEGRWLPREEVRERLKVDNRKSIGRAAELIVFFALVLLMAGLLLALLWNLAY